MANRHLSRSISLQTLFEWDFRKAREQEVEAILRRNTEEFAPGTSDFRFMLALVKGVLERRPDLDLIIEKAAPEWPIDKISIIDRNVLRIGLYELLFGKRSEVPAKVAINEAIELSKNFGGETSGKFVNGVLGAVYKEIGEPGKEEVSKVKKKFGDETPYEELPLEQLGGAVVYARHEGTLYLAFVHDIFQHWTLSKGKLEKGESEEEGTIRELKEEIGVDITIQGKIGENEYIASDPERGKIRKHVSYFIAETPYQKLTLGSSGGLQDARWFELSEVFDLPMYDDVIPLVAKGITMIPK